MPNPHQRQRQHGMVTVTHYRRRPQHEWIGDPNAGPEHEIPRFIRVQPAASPFNGDVIRQQAYELRRRRYDPDNVVSVPTAIAENMLANLTGWRMSS